MTDFSERDICTKFITPALERVTVNHSDPETLMQEYVEITRQLEITQSAVKQALMAVLGGRGVDTP